MAMLPYSDCPGCGAVLPVAEGHSDGRYNASAACWRLYGELTAYTLTRGDRESDFIHQLAVDAYGAQHVRADARPIGPAFALIGLYLACERNYSGRQVQHMHTLLARRSKTWPHFAPPSHAGDLTILDVTHAPPGEERDATLRKWSQSVWDAWGDEHERVRSLFEAVMVD
jgi:Family of unknown function (DUF5946)